LLLSSQSSSNGKWSRYEQAHSGGRGPGGQSPDHPRLAGTGYAITEAEDGEQAIAALTKERPDLILMEIQLPSMDGYEAMRRIRTDPALLSIPIIAVTSYAPNGKNRKRGRLAATTLCPSLTARAYCWQKFGNTYLNSRRSIAALHMSQFGPSRH
jgi:CheY-like chemotaxis protein